MMMMMKGFCIVVVVLVVVARGPVSGAKKNVGRPVINPIVRSAVIETCLQMERDQYKSSHGGATTKVEIQDVDDMVYKAKGNITVSIRFNRPELDPMDQFPRCKYELSYDRKKFNDPVESPIKLRSFSCVL